jgi:uncharacterized protein
MSGLKVAVIGSGVAGLSCAWLLSRSHDVTLFEADGRLGGHANTVDAAIDNGTVAVDTGFIVYNTQCYPNLIALFDHLGVETAPTTMGFSVSMGGGAYEYSGTGLQGLFGQPSNLFNPAHLVMARDILRFFRDVRALAPSAVVETQSLGDWLNARGYSDAFRRLHILPMAAAIWSAPDDEVLKYPFAAFARFFANHGLLQIRNRPRWRTVLGGSRNYVTKLMATGRMSIATNAAITAVRRTAAGAELTTRDGQIHRADHVVLACHADQARALLTDPSADEQRLLTPFRYQTNQAVLHTDAGAMPRRRRLWSAWNYIGAAGSDQLCVSYWMNALQPLPTKTDVFVTLNPVMPIAAEQTISTFDYAHPLFDAAAIAAQRELWRLQGQRGTWFAGSYFGSGFHEDGLQAGLWVAEALGGVRRPWTVAGENDRLQLGSPQASQSVAEVAA